MLRSTMAALLLAASAAAPEIAAGQQSQAMQKVARSGPRFGVTWLSAATVDTIYARYDIDVLPVITQFGWQFEKQWTSFEHGPVALNEFILLLGGLDQGVVIPSITWLVGIRTPGSFELGVGPNATAAGVALAISTGYTFRAGLLNVPLNMALVPSRYGMRASILTGFNIYR
jgi:hypothetical protein